MAAEGEVAHHVLEWLKNTKHVRVDILWLRACISWLKMDAANEYINIVVSIPLSMDLRIKFGDNISKLCIYTWLDLFNILMS